MTQLVPSLRKVKSMLDEDASTLLIDSAMRIVFRTFDTICNQKSTIEQLTSLEAMESFDGAESEAQKL